MSAQSQLSVRGLVRDPNGFAAAAAGSLRRAENVVIRSDGVAESRPNFQLLYEREGDDLRVMKLREHSGRLVIFEQGVETFEWSARLDDGTACTGPAGIYEPPSSDDAETSFVEARNNLYFTSFLGTGVLESMDTPEARFAGVEMFVSTDWKGADLSYTDLFIGWDPTHPENVVPIEQQVQAVAYRFVFVRKDANKYVRRSPPSYELVTTCLPNLNRWGSGTRFYLPYYTSGVGALPVLAAGDQVEFYRTRAVPMGSVRANVSAPTTRPEYFLAFTYTITAADVAAGYFAPPTDTVRESDLGAALYTNPEQGGAIAAKYAPPRARALAQFARCTWFANTVSKHRSPTFELQHLYRAGAMRNLRIATATISTDYLLLYASDPTVSAAGLVVGMTITDNYKYGPTVDGTVVKANTTITKIETVTVSGVDLTKITLSNTVLTGGIGGFIVGTMDAAAPQGLIAERTGTGVYVNGSKIVTSLASTAGWKAGMYWTDNPSGPSLAGTLVPANTKIQSVDSSTQITMTAAALNSATKDAYVGDCLKIDTLELYAWQDLYGGPFDETSHTKLQIWNGGYPYCFPIHDARYGDWGRQSACAVICQWVSWYAALYGVKAVPNGAIPTADYILPGYNFSTTPIHDGDVLSGQGGDAPDIFSGYGTTPYPNGVTGFSLEEVGVGGNEHTISSTCPSAFSPALDAPSSSPTTNDLYTNRVHFSDIDEPESVPLANYFDVGAQDEVVQALVPLRGALLVFKSDGLWRISGSAPSSWVVEQLDQTIRLVRPETVCVVNGVAYAWTTRGFFAVTEGGVQSLSANAIDVELREAAKLLVGHPTTHGAFVVGWQRRNLVLLGVPGAALATSTVRVYAFSLTTGMWSEWPMSWGTACESQAFDAVYYSRPPDAGAAYEVRCALETGPRGFDRRYHINSVAISLDEDGFHIAAADAAPWIPKAGDFVIIDTTVRRVDAVVEDSGTFFLTLDSLITDLPESGLDVAEGADIVLEWHPRASASAPVGAMVRELHVQMDLRDADATLVTTPRYDIGGTPEYATAPTTLRSAKVRVAQIQPIRAGASRQIARAASLAPFLQTSDTFALRVLGVSTVYERTSERTTR